MILLFSSVFLVAAVTTWMLTPAVKYLAPKIGAIDQPNERKIHKVSIPCLGGLAIYFGFMLAVYVGMSAPFFSSLELDFQRFFGIVIGATIILAVGVVDDIKGVSPLVKLFWQLVAAGIAVFWGVQIDFFSNPFNGIFVLGAFSIPITIFWIISITNAVNLIDGLDGLAAGVASISALTLFIIALRVQQIESAIFLIALAGASLVFLRFNFYPASIFLGDSGSLLLGYILAVSSVMGVLKTPLLFAFIIPVLVLGFPIYDTTLAILRRARSKRSIFSADNGHVHHGLLASGRLQSQAVLLIYFICLVLAGIALAITWINTLFAVGIFSVLILFAFIIFNLFMKKKRKQ